MILVAQDGRDFEDVYDHLREDLICSEPIKTGRWQSTDVGHIDALDTPEITDVSIRAWLPPDIAAWQFMVSPNLPWAEDHFLERVRGLPLNPGREYKNWPWYKGNVDRHRTLENRGENKFSHTYMERFWPKRADRPDNLHRGIRYDYGDLKDVVNLLENEPLTRQAYLPVWFPEDTGVVHGERVPCTIGYHFMIRRDRLSVTYFIRSCDFVRYFRDDIYMAGRLVYWLIERLAHEPLQPGHVLMHITSLHCFRGDIPKLERESRAYAQG